MNVTNLLHRCARMRVLCAAGVALGLAVGQAQAGSLWFDNNGTSGGYGTSNGGTYSWDGNVWATANGGTTATGPWVQGSFARFNPTVARYTVTVGSDIQMAGLYHTSSSVALTISQASGTSGQLDIVDGMQGFLIGYGASSVTITAPITGTGGIQQQLYGSLALYGDNSYSGGTVVTGGQVTYYNNSNSFGTGNISVQGYGQALVRSGSASVVIPNTIDFPNPNYAINLAGGNAVGTTPGTIFTGNFNLPASGTTMIETSNSTTQVIEISGVISGDSALSVADLGTLVLSGANSYTGSTTVTAAVNGPVTLKLGAANTIANTPSLVLDGGVLDPGGFDHAMSYTTLGLTASSTIDFAAGASEVDFANSSAISWVGILNLANWNPSIIKVRFGREVTGLTDTQLAQIEFNGDPATLGSAHLDTDGYLFQGDAPVPCYASAFDANGDGDVDMDDFATLQRCITGAGDPNHVYNYALCHCLDRDRNSAIDETDLAAFMNCASGPNIPVDPNCGNYPTGDVVINEIVYDTSVANGEFIELYNAGDSAVDISGWKVQVSSNIGPGASGNDDGIQDYFVDGTLGSGTVTLASHGFYVMGGYGVANVNQQLDSTTGDLFPNGHDAIQLLDANSTVKDTVIYGRSAGTTVAVDPSNTMDGIWGANRSTLPGAFSLQRWVDGRNTGDNGLDFGMRPATPGATNNEPVITAFIPPSGSPGETALTLPGSFVSGRFVDPTVSTAANTGSGTDMPGVNPNAITAPPSAGAAIIAWDDSGGGNLTVDLSEATDSASYDMWVYLETRSLVSPNNVPGAESTMYGLMGSADNAFGSGGGNDQPDPGGTIWSNSNPNNNGATGIAWLYQRDNAGDMRKLWLVDAHGGGNSSPRYTPQEWTVVASVDLSDTATYPSGWYELKLSYAGSSGAVTGSLLDASGNTLFTAPSYTTTPNLAGSFYVGYRESFLGANRSASGAGSRDVAMSLMRPPTFALK